MEESKEKVAPEPTKPVATDAPEAAAPKAEEPEPVAAPAPPPPRSAKVWNPQNLGVPKLPEIPGVKLFEQQFEPAYLKESPTYLSGSLAGDIGFDPWCLVALAKPNQAMDKTLRTAEARKKKMLSMSAEEQAECVAWMRDSELKHGRLAMLAAAGWPLAELANRGPALTQATNGRAPSLFNGHLLDYLPFLVVFFGGLAFLENTNKGKITDGNYGFDPLGFSTGKGPIPFDAVPKEVRASPVLSSVGNLEALKLSEMKNGRAAMMAITGFAVQEFVRGNPVVDQTPFFFR